MKFILLSFTFWLITAADAVQLRKRILGGTKQAKAHSFFASIRNHVHPESCGGTMISKDKLITAAHCLWKLDPSRCTQECEQNRRKSCPETCTGSCVECRQEAVSCRDACKQIIMGFYDVSANRLDLGMDTVSEKGVDFTVSDFKIWPWNSGKFLNDIAVLYLRATEKTKRFLPLLKFPKLDDSDGAKYLGRDLMVIGHGETGNHNQRANEFGRSPILMGRKVRLLSDDTCARTIRRETGGRITDMAPYLCIVGVPPGPQTPVCNGDSGGPLFYQNRDETVLIGVGSFILQKGCDLLQNTSTPAVYQRISYYLKELNAS